MWSLRVLSGPQTGQIFDLKLGKNVFGRGGTSDFKIVSVGISKEHCEVHVYKDKTLIVDLKSSNGTFVNGVKIQNSMIRVGDKLSLFDVIMDLIPTPDIRPKNNAKSQLPVAYEGEATPKTIPKQMTPVMHRPPQMPQQMQRYPQGQYPQAPFPQQGMPMMNGNAAYQMGGYASPQPAQAPPPAAIPQKSLGEKIDQYVENVLMPIFYKLPIIFSFKMVLMSFILVFIFGVTILSIVPLTMIIKETNLVEAKKRAASVAKSMAKINESYLLSGQLASLSVQEALKEDGIKEAFIVQHVDGNIVAPSDRAGRESNSAFILQARREARATMGAAGPGLIGASHPIGFYDPNTGAPEVKYHAIVIYNVQALNVDFERIISLFMQTLIIASVLGLILYFFFSRLIEFPIRSLNEQIDKALLEKSDRTEVAYDYPSFQKLVSNVNTLLNRVWSGDSGADGNAVPAQNKELEFSNLVEIISHGAVVINSQDKIIALNTPFEQLAQSTRDALMNQAYQSLTDSALSQNIEALIIKAKNSPYERHTDKIPFSQFECQISCQAFMNAENEVEFYFMTLVPEGTG